jgi:outer membrane receptor protein involved in Fe transport
MSHRCQQSHRDSERWQKAKHAVPGAGVRRLTAAVRAAFAEIAYRNKAAHLVGVAALGLTLNAMAEPVSVDLPAQPLADSLTQLAKKAGVSLIVDSAIVAGKTAPAVRGSLEPDEAFRRLLRGSGLQYTKEGDTALIRRQPVNTSKNDTIRTDAVEVTASRFKQVGPMPGLALTREEIPGNVQTITAEEIRESKAMTIAELFNSRLQSVNVNDYQGNPFQMDITYRGFTAGPQIGMPQGLSVFFDGVRVNEPFGDVVNWDLIPMNALASVDVFPGSNPVFGLNTLGGAVAMRTKNGFDDPGTDIQVLGGSFGRKQVMMSTGGSKGNVAGFFALNRFEEDGWRDNSPSKVMQAFGKASFRTDNLDLHGSVTYAGNDLIGNGLVPEDMYEKDRDSVFTSPDKTKNDLLQFQVAGAFQVNDTFSVTGQMYRRKSDRKAVTGDINRDFADAEFKRNRYATRRPLANEKPVCAFASTNQYGIPDYYVTSVEQEAFYDPFFGPPGAGFPSALLGALNWEAGETDPAFSYNSPEGAAAGDADFNGFNDLTLSTFNQDLPDEVASFFFQAGEGERAMFDNSLGGDDWPNPLISSDENPITGGPLMSYQDLVGPWGRWAQLVSNTSTTYYTDPSNQAIRHFLIPAPALNGPDCGASGTYDNATFTAGQIRVGEGNILRNGAWDPNTGGTSAGYVDGTPTAVMTTVDIGQLIKGGSLQANWDTGRHKFMVGTSLDRAVNTYTNSQLLALLNDQRHAYLAPDEIGAEFAAATFPMRNNDFSGSSKTRSLYFSETFTPVERFHFSASARYNHTRVMTNMRVRRNTEDISISSQQALWMRYLLCDGTTLADCNQDLLNNTAPTLTALGQDIIPGDPLWAYFGAYEKEVATYHKINPAVGASWSPTDHLNIYGNWNQGTRTPSAIELGCAFDHTIVTTHPLTGNAISPRPRSLVNGRTCTLPTALSGDPYLPQVVSRTLEFGGRGKLVNGWDWNASIYNTNLQDDIYFVAYTATQSFFDTIGKTRRRGLEMGLGGTEGKWNFRVNYSLTDATFESEARIANADNSSVNHNPDLDDWNIMTIKPGNRMPGIPLHNININLGFQATDKWRIGLTMVAHSWSYSRGNENNKHRGGVTQSWEYHPGGNLAPSTMTRRYSGDGKTPGYAVFNFNTSYDFGNGWIANLTVNNLLDKEYFSASRLDLNPFVPSINGAIGPGGFNYNSNDWQATTFVAPGAPRAAWFTLKYDFGADKRK